MTFFETHIRDKNILFQSWLFLTIYIFVVYRFLQVRQSICLDQNVSMSFVEYLFSAIIPSALIWSLPLIVFSTPIDWLLAKVKMTHRVNIIGAEIFIGMLTFSYLVIRLAVDDRSVKISKCSYAGNGILFDVFFGVAPLILAMIAFRLVKALFYYFRFKWRA